MKLTDHFELNEYLVSKDYPELIKFIHIKDQYKWNLFKLSCLMEYIRNHVNAPLFITSGYRTPELNKRIGGRKLSQHMFGEACDFIAKDNWLLPKALDFIKEKLHYFVGECIDYRHNNEIIFIHLSLPDPRWRGVFRTQEYKGIK